MSTLSSPKEWVTLAEAARHMSEIFSEEVTEVDMLQLALDGELTLSLDLLDGADARRCAPSASAAPAGEVVRLCGVWELPLIGGAPDAAAIAAKASFVQGLDGDLWQLADSADRPESRALVVRVTALYALYQATLGPPPPPADARGTSRREMLTHLLMIGGLLSLLLERNSGAGAAPFASQAAVIDALLARHPGKPGLSAATLGSAFAEGRRFFDAS